MPAPGKFTVLHYLGYDDARGGIVAVVRALATADRFACVLGMNEGFQPTGDALPVLQFSTIEGERLGWRTFWRSRRVASQVRAWLAADPRRIFHGHSRAGLAVALWLAIFRERRVVASVHCYGRNRWFYRWAAARLRERLFWLSPAMKRYYRVGRDSESWFQCIPGCVAAEPNVPVRPRPAEGQVVHLGGVGTLVSWKRWHLILDALAALPEATRDKLKFIHIGGDDGTAESRRYAEALRQQAAALRLTRHVEWRGHQPSSAALWPDIDCLVVGSGHEPLSVAMLEALFAGVPVLASNSGGARDVIEPGRNGWLFRPGDARDLSRTLAMLAESNALQRVRIVPGELMRFTAPAVATQWEEVYTKLAS